MKETRPKICFIVLTLLFSLLVTSGQSANYYRCVNSKGSMMLTNTVPSDPDFKCEFCTSSEEQIPQARAQEQRESDLRQRQQTNQAQEEARRADDSQNRRAKILAEIGQIEKEIQTLNDKERGRSSDKRYMNSPEHAANLRQIRYLGRKALMLRGSIEGVNEPQEAQKSSSMESQGKPDRRSPSDFLPKVGKYRWQVEDSSSTSPKSPSDFLPKEGKYRWQVE